MPALFKCILCNGNMTNIGVLLGHIHEFHRVANTIADRLIVKCGVMDKCHILRVLKDVEVVHQEIPSVKMESVVELDDETNRRSIEAPESADPNLQSLPYQMTVQKYNPNPNQNQMSGFNPNMNNNMFPQARPAAGVYSANDNIFQQSRPGSACSNDNSFYLNNQMNYPQPGPSSQITQMLNTSQMQQLLIMQQQQHQQQQHQQQQHQQQQHQQLQQPQPQQMQHAIWNPIPITQPSTITSPETKHTPSPKSRPSRADSTHPTKTGELDFCPYLTNNPRAVSRYSGQNIDKFEDEPNLPTGWKSYCSVAKRYRFLDSDKKYFFNSKVAVYKYLESKLGDLCTEEELAKFEKTLGSSSKRLI